MSQRATAFVLFAKRNQDLNKLVVSSALSTLFCLTLQLSVTATTALIIFFIINNALTRSFVVALQNIFVSVVLATAIVAMVVLVSPDSIIKAELIAIIVFFTTILISAISRYQESKSAIRLLAKKPYQEFALLIPFALLALLMRRWMAPSTPQAIFNLFGSEDNSAWISVARGFANAQISSEGLTHPTAKSPAIGPFTGLVSYISNFGTNSFNGRPHVLALETTRNCFAILIMSAALVSGAIVNNLFQIRPSSKLNFVWLVVPFALIAEAMVFTSLFVEHGYLSYMCAIVFVLMIFQCSTSSQFLEEQMSHHNAIVGVLLALGVSSSWWGTAPVGALMVVFILRIYWKSNNDKIWVRFLLASTLLLTTLIILNQLRNLIVGNSIPSWVFAVTGTVPQLSPLAIIALLLTVLATIETKVLQVHPGLKPKLFLGEFLLITITIYAMIIWSTSVIRTGVENYAAYKIIYILLPLIIPFAFILITQVRSNAGTSGELLKLSTVFFSIALLSSGWIYLRGPQLSDSSVYRSQVVKALDGDPNAIVLCLHSNDESRIQAYVCSRFAQGLSRSESAFTNSWLNAIVYPDRTPNGVTVPEDQTSGGRAVIELKKLLEEGTREVSIVVFPDSQFDPATYEWGDDFWWLKNIPWNQVTIVR
jgi:hypothetical protein